MKKRKPSVIYPQVAPETWAARYSLEIEAIPCGSCSRLLTPSVPFATGAWRGLMSQTHECGPSYDVAVAAAFDENGRNIWADICFGIKS